MRFLDAAAACGIPRKMLYTPTEVALACGVSRSFVYDELRRGNLKGRTRYMSRKYVMPEAVEEWLETMKEES